MSIFFLFKIFYSIVVLTTLIAMLISLGVAFKSLIIDRGKPQSVQTLKWLKRRVYLAIILVSLLLLGAVTGVFKYGAPWDSALKKSKIHNVYQLHDEKADTINNDQLDLNFQPRRMV